MYAEDEARKKWCPFARVAVAMKSNIYTTDFFGVGGCNRGPRSEQVSTVGTDNPSNPDSARCIASECMAWRHKSKKLGHDLEYMIQTHGEVAGLREWEKFSKESPLLGYCGLAGKP